jgi:transcriptional regulator with XRE-family HTH domain
MAGIGDNIRRLREEAGITQEALASKMGISRTALSHIEAGSRKVSAEELAKLADFFDTSTDRILGRLSDPEIEVTGKKAEAPKADLRISVPQKNLQKFREVLLYILNKVGSKPNVGQTVIYKLLYFIDFNYYEMYEEQLIGATYKKNRYGPTPLEFGKVVSSTGGDIEKVKSDYFTYPQTKYLATRTADLSLLTANEIKVIDSVIEKLSDLSARQISDYSHGDVPWKATPEGGIIDYESVFYRTSAYSVREYEDEV